jgi:hypothetical protein
MKGGSGAQRDQHEIGKPHRQGRREATVGRPGFPGRKQNVIADQDAERQREPASAACSRERLRQRNPNERKGETGEGDGELLVDLDEGLPAARIRLRKPVGRGEQLRERPRPDALLGRHTGARAVHAFSREEQALRGVPGRPVMRGIVRIDLVHRGLEQVEPEPVAREREPAAPRNDDPVRGLGLVAELQEDTLERASVRADTVEEEGDARPGLSKRAGGDDVDDRACRHPRHRPLEGFVGGRQDRVVDEKHQDRQGRGGAEDGTVEGRGPDAASPERRQFGIGREPPDADENTEQQRHRQGQHDHPRQREPDELGDLQERGAAAHRKVREEEDGPYEQDERVGDEAEKERRPDLSEDGAGDQAHQKG